MFVAIKMLVGDRTKYLALVVGVAFASLLVTQQASIFTGYALRTGAWVRDTGGADLWVMDDQVEFADDIKPMLDTAVTRVRGVEGVAWAVPMFKGYVKAVLPDGTQRNARVIGLDDATLAGGPPTMVAGTLADLRRDKAILINADQPVAMTRAGRPLAVGDRLSIEDAEAVVVGSYRATPEFFWEPVIYATHSRARAYVPDRRKTLMYVLVGVADDRDVAEVQRRVATATGLKVLTGPQFERQTMWWILNATGILVNFGITIALGFVIGLLVAGQTFYSFVLDNLRHFGALKAMGVGNRTILGMVAVQVLLVTAVGFGLGVGVAALTGRAFGAVGLAFEMPWPIPVGGLLAVLLCCLAAGAFSVVRVLRLEPGVVFR